MAWVGWSSAALNREFSGANRRGSDTPGTLARHGQGFSALGGLARSQLNAWTSRVGARAERNRAEFYSVPIDDDSHFRKSISNLIQNIYAGMALVTVN
jgi:hypothetical protein